MKFKFLLFLFLLLSFFQAEASRIISIGGTLTEIVYSLGAEKDLVGADTSSYYPKSAKKLPKVGYQRILSTEGILSLNPDLILLTEEAGPPSVIKQIKSTGISLLKLPAIQSLEVLKSNIRKIGKVLEKEKEAKQLIQRIERKHKKLLLMNKKNHKNQKPKKLVFILQHGGGAPMIAGKGTSADGIISLSGALNIAKHRGYKQLNPEYLLALEPDVILTTTRGLAQIGGLESFLKLPGVMLTPAGKNKKIIAMDALLILGFGPRVIDVALDLNKSY